MTEFVEQSGDTAERVQWIEHRSVRILRVDLSGIRQADDVRREMDRIHPLVLQEPVVSVLSLTMLRGINLSSECLPILRDAAARHMPYVRARALVGLPGIASLALRPFALRTGRDMQSFRSEEEAKDWLAEQAEK